MSKCIVWLVSGLWAVTALSAELPNVVMIMADDWGWSDIAAYRRHQGLDDPIATPNLDRMVADGMMFTDAHSPAALCAPTRFSMMTGSNPYRNGQQWGTWSFTATSAFTRGRKHVTVGEVAQSAGYRTAFFGKMHFGGGVKEYESVMPSFPTTFGFDYVFSTHGGIQDPPYLYFENDRFVRIDAGAPLNPSIPGTVADLKEWAGGDYTIANGTGIIGNEHPGTGDENWNSSQNGIINSRKAAGFIGDHLANYPATPFMVYYCAPQVHYPHTPPIDFDPNADGSPGSPPNMPVSGVTGGTAVADIIHELDLQVGWILNKLEDPNGDGDFADSVLTNTLVMFTSDNGGLQSDRELADYDSTGVLRGWKSNSYEGGHRVPFVAMWPGKIAEGSSSDQLICGTDWVGVLYALTSNSMAADQAMDCVNMLPTLLGDQPESKPLRDFLILQGHSTTKSDNSFIMRQDEYVLLMDDDREPVELYNLSNDLSQVTNLIAEVGEQQRILDMEVLFKQHDQQNEPRSTEAYEAPDIHPPMPSPSDFISGPMAVGTAAVSMTSVTGIDFSELVEYFFAETSGHEGGSSSGWQLSPTYQDDLLLPGLTYSYSVQMRDSLGHTGPASAVQSVTIGANIVLLAEDFEGTSDAGNVTNAPYPVGVFHHQDATGVKSHWTRDDQDGAISVEVGNHNSEEGTELRIGWGYDEVVTLYSTASQIDTNRTYTLTGAWEIGNTLDLSGGFIAGFAEFSGVDGSLVQRLTPDSLIFGNTNAPTAGETGSFFVKISPAELVAAGASEQNRIGLFFHHDDGGTLYDDNEPLKNDVYYINDVMLSMDGNTQFDQWLLNYGVAGTLADSDGDGADNLLEFAMGGDPSDPALDGFVSQFVTGSNGLHYVYPRRRDAGLIYWVETCFDLTSNNWQNSGWLAITGGTFSADFEAVTNEIPVASSNAFIRLMIRQE